MKFTFFVFLFFAFSVSSQEQFGMAMSNFTPSKKTQINPAAITDSKCWLDIQIASAGAYINNNLVYLNDFSISQLANSKKRSIGDNDIGFNPNPSKYNLSAKGFVNVLSAVWNQGDHGAGIFFGARSFTRANNFPNFLSDLLSTDGESLNDYTNGLFTLNNIYASTNNYAQIQLNYSYTFLKVKRHRLSGGIAFKKFIPLVGAGINFYDLNVNLLADSIARINHFSSDLMYTTRPNISLRGGFAFDFGVSYQKMMRECSSYYPNSKRMGCTYIPYEYKLGASIIDLGYVNHNPAGQFAGYEFSNFDYSYRNATFTENTFVNTFNSFESNIKEGKVKKNYRVATPAMLSLQADVNVFGGRFFAYGLLNQGIPIKKSSFGVRRMNSLMAGMRYESRLFDIAIPLSLYEYKQPQLGLCMRLYFLTIGTDKLINFIGSHKVYGADVYFSLNVPIVYYPPCFKAMKNRGSFYDTKRRLGRKNNKSRCDAF